MPKCEDLFFILTQINNKYPVRQLTILHLQNQSETSSDEILFYFCKCSRKVFASVLGVSLFICFLLYFETHTSLVLCMYFYVTCPFLLCLLVPDWFQLYSSSVTSPFVIMCIYCLSLSLFFAVLSTLLCVSCVPRDSCYLDFLAVVKFFWSFFYVSLW